MPHFDVYGLIRRDSMVLFMIISILPVEKARCLNNAPRFRFMGEGPCAGAWRERKPSSLCEAATAASLRFRVLA